VNWLWIFRNRRQILHFNLEKGFWQHHPKTTNLPKLWQSTRKDYSGRFWIILYINLLFGFNQRNCYTIIQPGLLFDNFSWPHYLDQEKSCNNVNDTNKYQKVIVFLKKITYMSNIFTLLFGKSFRQHSFWKKCNQKLTFYKFQAFYTIFLKL